MEKITMSFHKIWWADNGMLWLWDRVKQLQWAACVMVPGPDSGPFVLGLRSALQKPGDFPQKKGAMPGGRVPGWLTLHYPFLTGRHKFLNRKGWGRSAHKSSCPGPRRTGLALLALFVILLFECHGEPGLSSHYQNFSIFLGLGAQGKIRPRAMEEAVILILISTKRPISVIFWRTKETGY